MKWAQPRTRRRIGGWVVAAMLVVSAVTAAIIVVGIRALIGLAAQERQVMAEVRARRGARPESDETSPR